MIRSQSDEEEDGRPNREDLRSDLTSSASLPYRDDYEEITLRNEKPRVSKIRTHRSTRAVEMKERNVQRFHERESARMSASHFLRFRIRSQRSCTAPCRRYRMPTRANLSTENRRWRPRRGRNESAPQTIFRDGGERQRNARQTFPNSPAMMRDPVETFRRVSAVLQHYHRGFSSTDR